MLSSWSSLTSSSSSIRFFRGGRGGGGQRFVVRVGKEGVFFSSSLKSSSSGKRCARTKTMMMSSSSLDQTTTTTTPKKPKTALVPIANGSEEMETTVIVDVLRRAGCRVTVASCEDSVTCRMSRDVQITADCTMRDLRGRETRSKLNFDAIVVPGGMPGAERLGKCDILDELLKKQSERESHRGLC